MDDVTAARLAALRIEYAEARRELHAALDERKAGNARLEEMSERTQRLYLAIYLLEHDLTEDTA